MAFMGPNEPYNEGGRSIAMNGGEAVHMRTLDSYDLQNVSFIKMDVENYEDEVLAGAINTIRRDRPVIFLEIQGNGVVAAQQQVDRKQRVLETIDILEKLGYHVTCFSGADYLAVPKG